MLKDNFETESQREFVEHVCSQRAQLGWSQQELAQRAGCSRPTIARLEAGRVILSVTMAKVLSALNEGMAELEQSRAHDDADDKSAARPPLLLKNTESQSEKKQPKQSRGQQPQYGPLFSES